MSSAPQSTPKRITIPMLRDMKREGKRFAMVTAYDFVQARTVDEAGVEVILVGDSLSNVLLGHETTLPVTLDEMIYHCKAVVRARKRCLVVGDMPFLSYQITVEEAIRNAGRFLKEGGADCVKLEGGEDVRDTVYAIVRAGIPVMGHVGLTPQTVSKLGGYRVQGRDVLSARAIADAALALQDAGVFSIVLECVPAEVAREVTERLEIPTIGIGAGPSCDAQVLVYHDMLGLTPESKMRFVKRYAELGKEATDALRRFAEEVRAGSFPGVEHSFTMREGEEAKLPSVMPRNTRDAVGDGLVSPPGEVPPAPTRVELP
ncbi:MAG TPA: 3-methyl-2-oxobutanoate hydroxymethyltransferase [Planctomycetota bacterium]|nr:3-methyl-2-oxobutanoate hydroxymethyltransferase [Planctomycetota bacterium]